MNGDTEDEEPATEDVEEALGTEMGESYPAIQGIKRQVAVSQARLAETVEKMMEPIREQQHELVQVFQEYYEEVQTAVESTIALDEPWNYDPSTSTVHTRARKVATTYIVDFLQESEEIDEPYFRPIQHRMRVGLEAYLGQIPNEDGDLVDVKPRPHEAIFIFVSLQDSLMHWLCEQDDDIEPDKEYDQRNVYHSDTKQDALKDKYVSFHGIAPEDKFMSNLSAFYHHRNYIMHGSPDAHFDMNIATASILFFILTFHTVLEYRKEIESS